MGKTYDPSTFLTSGDFDISDPGFVEEPFGAFAAARGCPVHQTSARSGATLVTGYDAIVEAAANVPALTSSLGVAVFPVEERDRAQGPRSIIATDPPEHTPIRRTILPTFSPQKVRDEYEPITKALCEQYVAEFGDRPTVDGAVEYAQRIPARVIGIILGVPESMTDTFVGWVRDVLENAAYDPATGAKSGQELLGYFLELVQKRKEEPVDDLTSHLLAATTDDGQPLDVRDVVGNLVLMLIAGIDTTWSSIGSSLWHLAQHPEQRQQLRDHPELWPQAIEELLRAYAPVTMARVASEDTEIAGCPVPKGQRVWMSFSAANRDPEAFPDPDVVDFTREVNRHVAFGSGIHRCAGSNVARMELRVALQTFLERFPDFELDASAPTTWAGGQVRGPRTLPLVVRR